MSRCKTTNQAYPTHILLHDFNVWVIEFSSEMKLIIIQKPTIYLLYELYE